MKSKYKKSGIKIKNDWSNSFVSFSAEKDKKTINL